jgi:hypothetical protein
MKLKLWLTSFAILPLLATAQLNVELVSNLDYNPILNDIWGYVDKSGTEYALVGMTTGLSIVSLEDPADPREVQFINGVNSTWRDIKTWEDFAYVTADQGQDGLLIIDLSTLPDDTAAYAFYKPDIVGVGTLQKSHNIWIDEFGLAYLAGANIGGTAIFDLKSDPWNPEFLTNMPYDYAHDVYVRDSLVYASEIYKGQLGVYRISDLANITDFGFYSKRNRLLIPVFLHDQVRAVDLPPAPSPAAASQAAAPQPAAPQPAASQSAAPSASP